MLRAVTLTGKPYSAKLALDQAQLQELRENMEPNLKLGGKKPSVTPSTALLNQKLGISPAPRMLTPSEIELLRRSKQEIAEAYRAKKAAASR